MENIKIELKWAVVFMQVTLTWIVIEKVSGLYSDHIDKHAIYSNLFMIPAITVYVFALIDKRNDYYEGSMTYKQGFVSGVLLTVFVTLLSPLTQYVSTEWIGPEYFPNIIAYNVEIGALSQADAENYYNLKSFIMEGLIATPLMGLFTTALVALFTKRKLEDTELEES